MKTYRLSMLLTIGLLSTISLIAPFSHAELGTGRLCVYSDPGYTILVNQDEHGFYQVLSGSTVYIQVAGITEFDLGNSIIVKICWSPHTKTIGPLEVIELTSGAGLGEVGVGDAAHPIEWLVGDFDDGFWPIPVCETMTVHYKSAVKPPGPDYVTTVYDTDRGMAVAAHLHSMPEIPLGTLGTISAIFLGFSLFILIKRKPSIFTRPILKT